MKYALATVACLAACTPEATDPPWSLDHDRVVAVRAEPPHIAPGEVALLEALVAHAGGPLTTAAPLTASSPTAPGGLFVAVHFYFDHWQIDGPEQSALDVAREELGLPAGAPVPLDVVMQLPGPLYAQKTVWLGDTHANPPAPAFALAGPLRVGEEIALDHEVPPGWSVRWLTSCGSLARDTTPHATLSFDEPCDGELVLVVRDPSGGTTWQVVALRAT